MLSRACPGGASAAGLVETPHSGWLWSNPTPQGNNLNGVAFLGEVGFAVGEEGTVLHSEDGGRTWAKLPSGTHGDLSLVQELNPETVIVGGECRLRESRNGGRSFTAMALDRSAQTCTPVVISLSFQSAEDGFVETDQGAILWTGNGGASFEARAPLPLGGGKPGPMQFLSSSVGLALVIGDPEGRIMRTSDGGRSWFQVASSTQPLAAISFATPLIGYAVGAQDTMLRTEDGGMTWRTMPLALAPGNSSRDLTSISCSTAESCLMTALTGTDEESDAALITRTGGLTGEVLVPFVRAHEQPRVAAISWPSSDDAIAVGTGGATSVSDDDGASFGIQVSGGVEFEDFFQELHIRPGASRREAYIAAEHGRIATTSDGGHSWRTLSVPTKKNLLDVAFPSSRTGFTVNHAGTVYSTSDGGRSWRQCGREGRTPGSLLAPSARTVIVTSEHGIWRSNDGCHTFHHVAEEVSVNSGHGTRALASFDLELGGAEQTGKTLIVFGRQILESDDEGATWTLIAHPPTPASIAGISFLSPSVGYALLEGRLYFTRNRGGAWREILSLPSNEHPEPPSISFSSIADGYVTTRYADEESGNIIFRTEDGGRTWTPEALPSHAGDVLATGNLAYAAYEGGEDVYVTDTGGLAGLPSRLGLSISGPATRSRRSLARAHHAVTIHGRLTPPVAGAEVEISWLTGGGWQAEAVTTNAQGDFSLTVQEIEATTWFVAQWSGDDLNRGAGTPPVRLTVPVAHSPAG